ncbi:MAG: zinc-dependent alcohol dehydrogenase family protein [Bacteroidetes bacterium]|nr:zinc-dependent alcohol dehydrogenase family protein [Bacteroidota bacterium]
MKALVYHGAGNIALEEKLKPTLKVPTDAVVRVTRTTICGTDLHILKGDVPTVTDGRILGHEGIGVIDAVGVNVSNFAVGDKVLISCITCCGKCSYCRKGMYSHCVHGGWILGNTIDGTQAEFVRIPHADMSLHHIPKDADEDAMVLLSDILPTGYECGVLNGRVSPGNTVAIIGAGPIGLAALLTAQFYSPSVTIMVDTDPHRLEIARTFGATHGIRTDAVNEIMKLTGGIGVDVAIEAVGTPDTFAICQSILAPGGHLANIGVHGKSVELHLETLWSKNVTITTRLVDTVTTPMLLNSVLTGTLSPAALITHHFLLTDVLTGYDTFRNAGKEKALKVIITNER